MACPYPSGSRESWKRNKQQLKVNRHRLMLVDAGQELVCPLQTGCLWNIIQICFAPVSTSYGKGNAVEGVVLSRRWMKDLQGAFV
mmetsp:Transcript_56270/g.93524  ORF Transcript_56270/g.93524 Transcript_56270/m.93524 type:complete len:85 (+) Transcript_56270:511-765(+)